MAVAVPFTTEGEMEAEVGADAITEWSDHDEDGARDTGVVSRTIDRATNELIRKCHRYSVNGLAADAEIRGWATQLACFFLSKSRGNPPAMALVDDVDYIRGQLDKIESGSLTLNIPWKSDLRPRVINREIDRRYVYRNIRETPDSTKPRSVLPEHRSDDAGANYGIDY